MADPTPGGPTPTPGGPPPDLEVDADAFWRGGDLPQPAATAEPDRSSSGLDAVGRPGITVDGRNLADVLRPVYAALRRDS